MALDTPLFLDDSQRPAPYTRIEAVTILLAHFASAEDAQTYDLAIQAIKDGEDPGPYPKPTKTTKVGCGRQELARAHANGKGEQADCFVTAVYNGITEIGDVVPACAPFVGAAQV